ncbi:hypothetical protein [Mycobacterium lentiflavum]|nr:hypothetical protein [Mycobacterium lentiflavum]
MSVAKAEYQGIVELSRSPEPRNRHPDQVYSPIGAHVPDGTVQALINDLTLIAKEYGYPGASSARQRVEFDRAAARRLLESMSITWADAGNPRLWSFVSLIALPHLTWWRFGPENNERWIATDLTRHTWARLWWQAVVFRGHEGLLDQLSESDLNQLLERRVIGGDPRLARCLAQAIVSGVGEEAKRRALIRDVTKRMRRLLAFVDALALDGEQVMVLCTELVTESRNFLTEPEIT